MMWLPTCYTNDREQLTQSIMSKQARGTQNPLWVHMYRHILSQNVALESPTAPLGAQIRPLSGGEE